MEQYTKSEVAVGAFVLLGLAALAYVSASLGNVRLFTAAPYHVTARFATVGDLTTGAPVKLAGVEVGEVTAIDLQDYTAHTTLAIRASVQLPKDTIASIETAGLLGGSYVSLSPGASAENLNEGDAIAQTEPAKNLMHLISQYAFGPGLGESGPKATSSPGKPAGSQVGAGGAPQQSDVFSHLTE